MSLVCPSGLLVLDPALCRPVDIYCERTSAALTAEPVNALTNIGFLVAAWAAWRFWSKHRKPGVAGTIELLIAMTVIVGLGSFLFHTVATRWAEWGDVIPILAFVVVYLWLVLTRLFSWRPWPAFAVLLVFTSLTLYAEAEVPEEVLWGGAMYLPTLFAIVATSVALYRRDPVIGRAMLAAGAVFLSAFAARTLDMPVCSAFPLGTHFLWHLLNALLLYLLVRLGITGLPASARQRPSPVGTR